jgi:hypothetical protein
LGFDGKEEWEAVEPQPCLLV